MFELLLNGATGGLLGVVGALFKHGIEAYQERKKAEQSLLILKEQNAHEAIMAEKQAALIELEAKHALALADLTVQKEIDVAAYGALSASYDHDKATYSDAPQSPWMIAVDAARGFIRPFLTLIFSLSIMIMTAWLWVAVPEATAANPDFLKATLYRLLDAQIFMATTAMTWWFAARQVNKS